ncbi:hypothetical protein KR038_010232, partial [Drosophila bunnanda]
NNYVNSVCLPDSSSTFEGSTCVSTGWGHTRWQGTQPAVLQEVDLPIVNHAQCQRSYQWVNTVTAGMICAGYSQGGKGVCQGDSGGPLVCKVNGQYQLAGVTSWGVECAKAGYPGVYARVTQYLSWI